MLLWCYCQFGPNIPWMIIVIMVLHSSQCHRRCAMVCRLALLRFWFPHLHGFVWEWPELREDFANGFKPFLSGSPSWCLLQLYKNTSAVGCGCGCVLYNMYWVLGVVKNVSETTSYLQHFFLGPSSALKVLAVDHLNLQNKAHFEFTTLQNSSVLSFVKPVRTGLSYTPVVAMFTTGTFFFGVIFFGFLFLAWGWSSCCESAKQSIAYFELHSKHSTVI